MTFTLLLGGVRSGKSRLAVGLASRASEPVVFLATAEARDDHMTERIDAHRAERPDHWSTVEVPMAIEDALASIDRDAYVVLDCLTVWTSNLLLAGTPDPEVTATAERVAAALAARPGGGVVVTNEVGMGVHPSSELGRHYRDLLGAVNIRFADMADQTALVMAGRALPLVDARSLLG